jgi:hypothetical protein
MQQPDFFNCEDHLIVVKVNGINGFMEVNGDRLHFPAGLQTINLGLTADFVGALNANDAVNAGDSDKERLNEARAALIAGFRITINDYLRNNEYATDQDRVDAGLNLWKKSRARKAAPTTCPFGNLRNDKPGHFKGSFHDQDSTRFAVPATADSMEILIEYDDESGGINTWQRTFHNAHPRFSVPSDFCNRKLRARVRWLCDNGNEGEYGEPFDVVAVRIGDLGSAPIQGAPPAVPAEQDSPKA